MSCPEYPPDCCPPPGGGGLVVSPLKFATEGWPDWAELSMLYLAWEVDAIFPFQVTSATETTANGHIIAQDGRFNRLAAPVAQSQQQVAVYLVRRTEQLAYRAQKMAAAKIAFHDQAGVEWPDYVGGGVVLFQTPHPAMGDIGRFWPFSYPDAGCRVTFDGGGSGKPLIVTATFSSGDGYRVIRNATVLRGLDVQEFERLRNIWVPLYNAAVADVDEDYPQP